MKAWKMALLFIATWLIIACAIAYTYVFTPIVDVVGKEVPTDFPVILVSNQNNEPSIDVFFYEEAKDRHKKPNGDFSYMIPGNIAGVLRKKLNLKDYSGRWNGDFEIIEDGGRQIVMASVRHGVFDIATGWYRVDGETIAPLKYQWSKAPMFAVALSVAIGLVCNAIGWLICSMVVIAYKIGCKRVSEKSNE